MKSNEKLAENLTMEDQSSVSAISKAELIDFVRSMSICTLVEVRAREQAEKVWRSGSDDFWKMACALDRATAGKALTQKSRLKEADLQYRIALKKRRELEMLAEILRILNGLNESC